MKRYYQISPQLILRTTPFALLIAILLAMGIHVMAAPMLYEAPLPPEPERKEARIRVKIEWTVERTKEEIRKVFPDAPIMLEVARCESQYRHYLDDGRILRGIIDNDDTGLMQINLRWHGQRLKRLGLDAEDLQDNLKYARILYDENGLRDWNASRPCWSERKAP